MYCRCIARGSLLLYQPPAPADPDADPHSWKRPVLTGYDLEPPRDAEEEAAQAKSVETFLKRSSPSGGVGGLGAAAVVDGGGDGPHSAPRCRRRAAAAVTAAATTTAIAAVAVAAAAAAEVKLARDHSSGKFYYYNDFGDTSWVRPTRSIV